MLSPNKATLFYFAPPLLWQAGALYRINLRQSASNFLKYAKVPPSYEKLFLSSRHANLDKLRKLANGQVSQDKVINLYLVLVPTDPVS